MNTDGTSSTEITETDGASKVFRLSKSYRTEGASVLALFTFLFSAFFFFMWFEAPPDRRVYVVIFIPLFWLLFAILPIWSILAYHFKSLTIGKGKLIQQGIISRNELDLSSVKHARWNLIPSRGITLTNSVNKTSISFDSFEHNEQLWLIQFFQSHFPESIQINWDFFCLKIALPLREPKPDPVREPGPDEILITRKRYDRIGIPLNILSIICVTLFAWYLRTPQYLVFPAILIGLWLFLRYLTPKQGLVDQRISADKTFMKLWIFLGWWSGAGLIGFIAFILADLPHSFRSSVGWCMASLWISVVWWKIYQSHRDQHKQDLEKAKEAVQKWNLELDPHIED